LLAVSAAAQTVSFSISGTGSSPGSISTGTGNGSLVPGGPATASFTGRGAVNDACNNAAQTDVTFTLSGGDTLRAHLLQNSVVQNPAALTVTIDGPITVTGGTGAYANQGGSGVMHIVLNVTSDRSFSFTSNGSLTLAGPLTLGPIILPGGVGDVFSDNARVAPGAWASVFGANLSSTNATWNGDFPTTLGGVSATLDGKPVYLWSVSPGQINFQVPDGTKTGCVPFVLNTPGGAATSQVEVQPAAPSFSMLDGRYVAAVILTPNGSGSYGNGSYDIAGPVGRFPYKTRPVRPGENVVLYGVGFGPTSPAVPAGKAFSGSAKAQEEIHLVLDSGPSQFFALPVDFAGVVAPGLFQINTTIPANAPAGDAQIGAAIIPDGPYSQLSFPIFIPIGQ
jgi:uncharacterized protein (TIGR03437 family)